MEAIVTQSAVRAIKRAEPATISNMDLSRDEANRIICTMPAPRRITKGKIVKKAVRTLFIAVGKFIIN